MTTLQRSVCVSNYFCLVIILVVGGACLFVFTYFESLGMQSKLISITQAISNSEIAGAHNEITSNLVEYLNENNNLEIFLNDLNYCNDGFRLVHLIQGDVLDWKDLLDANIAFLTFANKSR